MMNEIVSYSVLAYGEDRHQSPEKHYQGHKCTLPVSAHIADALYTEDLPPTAKPCQRFIRLIRKTFLVSTYHRGTKAYLGSELAFLNERRRHINAKYWFMIHPFSLFILCWKLFILTLWILGALLIPYTIFLHSQDRKFCDEFVLGVDIIACIDIVIKFFTAFYNPVTKEIIFDLSTSASNYAKSDLIIDIVGSIPFQAIFRPLKKESFRESMYAFKILRTRCLIVYLEAMYFQFETNLKVQFRINIILKSIMFINYTAGCYFQLSRTVHYAAGRKTPLAMWIVREDILHANASVWRRYQTTLFYVTGLVSTSGVYNKYPKTMEETCVVVIIMYAGYAFLTYLVIMVYCYNVYTHHEELQYNRKSSEIEFFIKKKGIEPGLRKKIVMYINYKWEGKYIDEEKIMQTLSKGLKLEIKLYECEKLLNKVKFLRHIPKEMFLDLIEYLQLETYLPGSIIIEAGTIGKTMYLIKCGSISIRNTNGKELVILSDGDCFGESCIIQKDALSNELAVSIEISEIYHLMSEDWHRCLSLYPHAKNMFE